MMKKYLLLVATLLFFSGLHAQISIPDQNLRSLLLAADQTNYIATNAMNQAIDIDVNNDNGIDAFEASAVYSLTVRNANIQSLEGLQFFGYLRTLDCSANALTALDPIAYMPNLVHLFCTNNQLTSQSFSGLTVNTLQLQLLDCSFNQIQDLGTVVSAFPNLNSLNCMANAITTLAPLAILMHFSQLTCDGNPINSLSSISGLASLASLSCNSCGLTTLDGINAMSQLIELKFANNQIAQADLSHWPNLRVLECSYNLLTALEINLTPGLVWLRCTDNSIPALNLAGSPELSSVECQNNQLTALDLSASTYMQYLLCGNNQITSLDLSHCGGLVSLECSNNQLTSLSIKNGKHEFMENIVFPGNPDLGYICADENQVADIESLIAQYEYTNCHVNSYCSFVPGGTYYTIQGSSKYDANANGCDASDIVHPNLKLSFSDGVNTGNVIADQSGNYHNEVQMGTHEFIPVLENPGYFTVTPASASVQFLAQPSPFMQDFCLAATGVHPDLEISIVPLGAARPGFDCRYKVIYKNKGTITQSGSIHLAYDDSVLDFVSADPWIVVQTANLLLLDYDELAPFESGEFIITFNANSPIEIPALNNGAILNFTVSIVSGETDETPDDNTATLHQTVVNSFDPNDITLPRRRNHSARNGG
jgi:Leucine-rich repeat (LRR) protein